MAEYEKTIAQMIGGCLPGAPLGPSVGHPWLCPGRGPGASWTHLQEAPHTYAGPWGPWRHLDGHCGTGPTAHLLGKGFGLVPGKFGLLLLGETRNPV